MTTTYTIFQVRDAVATLDGASVPVWLISYMRSDTGLPHTTGFPHEIFANLCAEYEHDPYDIDTLIDLAVHQVHMDIRHTDEDFVYKATVEQARAGHLAKLAASRREHVYVDEHNLLDVIRQHHDPQDPRIPVRRAQVRALRAAHRRALGLDKETTSG